MPFQDGNLILHNYGDPDAPAGAGKGGQDYKTLLKSIPPGKKFEDPHFPANCESLGELNICDPRNMKWLRPHEIAKEMFNAEPIFKGKYDEFGVNQGAVGDCWFLAVLADVALLPDCINTVVPLDNSEENFKKGIFHFRFWCRGKWIDVVVDDLLPCICEDDGSISMTAFTKPTASGGFWAPLLEKAYAKIYGKYSAIALGISTDAMIDFTGGFIQRYQPPQKDWKDILQKQLGSKAIVSMGTIQPCPSHLLAPPNPKNPGVEGVSKEGIVCGHVYSILDMQEVSYIKDPNQKETLIKLRNPWGDATEWNGAFSDHDSNWANVTPNYRKNPEDKKDDGEFWMPIESMIPYLASLHTCHWGLKYRGLDGAFKAQGFGCLQTTMNFTAQNSGPSNTINTNTVQGKPGYVAHLKPVSGGTAECGIVVNLLYEGYDRAGHNPQVPKFGFIFLWAPGKHEVGPDFFNQVEIFKIQAGRKGGPRDVNYAADVKPGTALILPWIFDSPANRSPVVLRIAVEGEVNAYNP